MPIYEFQCRFCEAITGVYLHDGDKLNYRAMRCEHCGKRHLILKFYAAHADHMIALLQDQIEDVARRIEELENSGEAGQDYEVKN